MSNYIRRRPPRGLEIDSDLYAFDSPSDYLGYDMSDFSSPESFMAHTYLETLRRAEKAQYAADVHDRNWTSYQPSVSISKEDFYKAYDQATHEENPFLRMFENYEGEAAAPFTNFEEFMQYMSDVHGRNWTSDVPSASLSRENPFQDYDEVLLEAQSADHLWCIADRGLVSEYLYGPDDEGYDKYIHCLDQLQIAHNAAKSRRSKRRVSTIRTRTKLIKRFMPGSGFLWERYKTADDGNYDHLPRFWEELTGVDTVRRFGSRVHLAAHYEGYFLVAGRFVKYDPMPKEERPIVAHDGASDVSDAENNHSKFYIPKVPLSADPIWKAIMKRFRNYLLQHSPKYHGNISYLPKKRLASCGKTRKDMFREGTKVVTSNIRSYNQPPKLYHMPIQLRHFINI